MQAGGDPAGQRAPQVHGTAAVVAEPVHEALESCPRLAAVVAAVGALPAVREWEMRRPDTFS